MMSGRGRGMRTVEHIVFLIYSLPSSPLFAGSEENINCSPAELIGTNKNDLGYEK